jgi:hypothetical protein
MIDMPQKGLTGKDKRDEKRKKQGLVVVEVARANNEGRIPTTQQEIRKIIKDRYKIDIAPSTLTGYIQELKEEELGKKWLSIDGHDVSLAAPETTLTDSLAIDALHIAHKVRDEDGNIAVKRWLQLCSKELLEVSPETYINFLDEYNNCGYLLSVPLTGSDVVQLDIFAYNQDSFYLRQAGRAKLKKLRRRKKR